LSFAAVSILHAVASGAAYGFEVIDATALPSGTVYPALGRLERDGLVTSSWEEASIAQEEKRPHGATTGSPRLAFASSMKNWGATARSGPSP
jgi:PadR family transcriptional regulator PadR